MRCILLESNDDLAALLPDLFTRAGITLMRVRAKQTLLMEATFLRPNDFLLLDCSTGESEDWERCLHIVQATSIPIFIIHPPGKIFSYAKDIARGPVEWISSDFGILPMLDKLRNLRNAPDVFGAHLRSPKLSPQEQQVLKLLAKGCTNLQIADALNIREGTVKTYLSRIGIKWGLSTRDEILEAYCWIRRSNTDVLAGEK